MSRAISQKLNELEHTKDDAFPSGHTMITVFCLLVAYRESRRLFRAWLPIAILLIVSTMYCRFHYVVDVIAGLSLAFVALPVGDRLYAWMRGGVFAVVARAGRPCNLPRYWTLPGPRLRLRE